MPDPPAIWSINLIRGFFFLKDGIIVDIPKTTLSLETMNSTLNKSISNYSFIWMKESFFPIFKLEWFFFDFKCRLLNISRVSLKIHGPCQKATFNLDQNYSNLKNFKDVFFWSSLSIFIIFSMMECCRIIINIVVSLKIRKLQVSYCQKFLH